MRLIDADALLENLPDVEKDKQISLIGAVADMVVLISNAPTIDAVSVVRCKDCRYSEPMKKHGVCKFGENALNCTQCRGDDGYGYAGISVIYPDDYCSDGAQKDGEADD